MQGSFGNHFVLSARASSAIPIISPDDSDHTAGSDLRVTTTTSPTSDIDELSDKLLEGSTKKLQSSKRTLPASSVYALEFVPKSATITEPSTLNTTATEDPHALTDAPLTKIAPHMYYAAHTYGQTQSSALMHSGGMVMDAYQYHQDHARQDSKIRHESLHHGLYAPSSASPPKKREPNQKTAKSFFIPEQLRILLTRRNEDSLPSSHIPELGLPKKVGNYHSLQPLGEDEQGHYFENHPLYIYRAQHEVTNCSYALVRIKDVHLTDDLVLKFIDNWIGVHNNYIVRIQEAFATLEFGDSSLIFVYHYHSFSKTLYSLYFSDQVTDKSAIDEAILWKYATQIASAIRAIHHAKMAARNIDSRKILVTDEHRLRLNYVGILDVIKFDGEVQPARHQQEDLLAFGNLLTALACMSPNLAANNKESALQFIENRYSPDLFNFILYLLSKPGPNKTIDNAVTRIGSRILIECNKKHIENDKLESMFSRELYYARLVRWQTMIGFITERPKSDIHGDWSNTELTYRIPLFRDYVFHQVDENGSPVADLAHVLMCLKKLDAGIDEKVMLEPRDEKVCIIVSYKDMKQCILRAYEELVNLQCNGRR